VGWNSLSDGGGARFAHRRKIEVTFTMVRASREEMEAGLVTIEIDHVYGTVDMRKRLKASEDEVSRWKNKESRS
jgi:hypothetical protein